MTKEPQDLELHLELCGFNIHTLNIELNHEHEKRDGVEVSTAAQRRQYPPPAEVSTAAHRGVSTLTPVHTDTAVKGQTVDSTAEDIVAASYADGE